MDDLKTTATRIFGNTSAQTTEDVRAVTAAGYGVLSGSKSPDPMPDTYVNRLGRVLDRLVTVEARIQNAKRAIHGPLPETAGDIPDYDGGSIYGRINQLEHMVSSLLSEAEFLEGIA